MKKILLYLSVVLISCSKSVDLPSDYLEVNGQRVQIQMSYSAVPYCGTQNIYSFTSSDQVLISVVADSLPNGTYHAGLNWWNHMQENIILTRSGNSFQFTGQTSKGQFKLIP